MAYARTKAFKNKRMYRQNRRYRKRYHRGMSVSQAAHLALRGVKFIKGIVNAEKKKFTQSISQTPNNTGTVVNLCNIAAGDDASQRDGNSILLKYIDYKLTATINASATSTTIRQLIFIDKSNQNSNPSVTDVLENASQVGQLNVDNVARFWILSDKMYTVTITGDQSCNDHIYIPCDFHVKYNGTASGNTLTNTVYLLLISNEATNTPTITGYTRLAWYDN